MVSGNFARHREWGGYLHGLVGDPVPTYRVLLNARSPGVTEGRLVRGDRGVSSHRRSPSPPSLVNLLVW